MDDTCELSLILPAYNEDAGIAHAVAEADAALGKLGVSYEVIVVDDGSSDRTANIVDQIARERPGVRLVRHECNRGYGAALRAGFDAARGARIAFTDADCQFHLDDVALLLPLTQSHSIAVGYRVNRQDPWLRKFYSRGYNLLARALLGTTVRDIDCALKVFRREALAQILPESDGFFVNTEMLTRARQLRLPVAEIGVRHRPRQRGASKVSTSDIPRVLRALLPFWWLNVMFPTKSAGPARLDTDGPNPRIQACLMAILFLMASVLFLGRLDHPLLEPEEARYAEIPRQMLEEGRFLTPVLHGEDYWQKPPLLYWLVMLSYQVFGIHDWSARLIPCLAGILSVALTTWWAWRTLGFWSAFVSGMMLTLSVRFLYLAGMLTMDGLLCTCVVAGLMFGHLALTEARNRRGWLVLAAIACALGILTKGPVALVLIAVPLGALAFLDRRCRFVSVLETLMCLGVVALLAAPWFIVMALRDPEAAGAFVWVHHFTRYLAPVDHEKPAWFYVPSLLLGMLPWSLLLVPLVPYLWRKSRRASERRPAALGMFVLAFLWCLLFFSMSGCKRPGYILPALPFLALILGTFVTHGLPWQRWMHGASLRVEHVQQLGHRWAMRLTLAAIGMGVAIGAAAAVVDLWSWPHAIVLASVLGVLGILVRTTPTRFAAWTSWANCAVVVFVVLLLGQRVWLPDYHARFGLRRQVEIYSEYEQEESLPIVSYPKRWDSIGFYAKRRDIDSYAPAEVDEMIRDLRAHGKAILFVRRAQALDEIRRKLPANMNIEVLGRDRDFVVACIVRMRE